MDCGFKSNQFVIFVHNNNHIVFVGTDTGGKQAFALIKDSKLFITVLLIKKHFITHLYLQAIITSNGKLTPPFEYINELRMSNT